MDTNTRRTAVRWLWALIVVATLLAGALSYELKQPAAPITGLAVGIIGLLFVATIVQASRLMVALTRRPPR